MMLRDRKGSSTMDAQEETMRPVKRPAADVKDEPKRKRGGLSVLSNVISNALCIDSTKKVAEKPLKTSLKCQGSIFNQDVQKERLPSIFEPNQEDEEAQEESSSGTEAMEEDSCPDYDYDAINENDPFMVSEYAFDIFRYYKHREQQFRIGNYRIRQIKITKEMRAALVDWMVDIQESFELNHETLYTAIKIMDHYLDKTASVVDKQDLQLLGSTATFIASKFEERYPPAIDDFLYVCNESFTREQMLVAERDMLNTVGFDLGYPLAYRFLRRYAKVLRLNMPTLTLARYYLETCTLYYEFVSVSDSLMASACLLLALRVKGLDEWNSVLIKYTGYVLSEVEPMMYAVNHAMIMRPKVFPHLMVVFNKYSCEVFFEVASLSFLIDRFNSTDPVGPPQDAPYAQN